MNLNFRYDVVGYVLFAVFVLLVMPMYASFDGFQLNTYARYLTLGLAAMALALSWGYAGILNLGQAGSFALGSYIMAAHLKLKASENMPGGMPDFMGWTNLEALPWFWQPFHSVTLTLLSVILLPAIVASIIGVFMFRGRITGVFVAIITLSFLVAFQLVFVEYQMYTGGENGLTGLAPLELFNWTANSYSTDFYYFVAGCLIIIMALTVALVRSKVGLILRAIKENPDRVRFFGYNVASYEIMAFSTSAAIASWAGMLYALVLQFASPSYMSVSFSLAIVIWCAVGGRNSLVAAALGGIIVNALQGRLSEIFVEGWMLFLGVVFILVVLFMPNGIYGLLSASIGKFKSMTSDGKGHSQAIEANTGLPMQSDSKKER
ncbi:urea ABC transporter permease subunit UrtC [Halomonas sp. BC04]|uniref:urea ABC transporter permease subunit UrtC n=1 Tax=Halomonas sp. BC04 TaxID=1403540 RepID=UPI0003ED75F1|nr:urea ABC transporter permease subunit UrtC [Halomonas sp. BC04]EWH03737.1 urea ABC transporter permease [Halomonas sp. BC04]